MVVEVEEGWRRRAAMLGACISACICMHMSISVLDVRGSVMVID